MVKKVSRRGRPSRLDVQERAYRSQPLTAQPEGVRFRLLRDADEGADVEHYWARGAFYEALRVYAHEAYRELTEIEYSSEPDSPTRFDQFRAHLEATLAPWCSKHAFLEDDRVPGWLSPDMFESFMGWDPKQGPLPLNAFWRARWDPVKDDGQLIEPNPDSAEARAVLRIELVRTEVDGSGAATPVVISPPEAKAELVQRFAAFIELELPSLFAAAAKCGIHEPSDAILKTIMRRYVLKQFRRLDSVDIAVCEARGDPACQRRATEKERTQAWSGSRRRDVDDAIKQASDMLGVPAKPFRRGPKPKQLYRNIVHRKG
jgi:hypothetical protein